MRATVFYDGFENAAMDFDPAPGGPGGRWYIGQGAPLVLRRYLARARDAGRPLPLEMFVPIERRDACIGRGGRKRKVYFPLFGRYFFLRMDLSRASRGDESRAGSLLRAVRESDGFGDFVGIDAAGWPSPVRDLATFQQLYARPVMTRETPVLTANQAVCVTAGPFAGMRGTVQRLRGPLDSPHRVVIRMLLMGSDTPAELPVSHVEALTEPDNSLPPGPPPSRPSRAG